MPEKVLQCPLCKSERSQPFDTCTFHGQSVENRLCLRCGLVYQSPRMTDEEARAFYAREYRSFQEGSANPTERNMAAQKARADSLCEFIRPVVSTVLRHLDIGCSSGSLLLRFQAAYYGQSVGVEPGDAHRNSAQQQRLTAYATLGDLEESGEARFDLVSMSHVLEHLPDPIGYLTHLRDSILTPDGWLLLEVPNLYAHDSFEVAHLLAFSPHTLREVLRLGGFEVVKFEMHGRPSSAILPLFLTMLCRPTGQPGALPIHPERGVVWKRRIGMFRRKVLGMVLPSRAWLRG